MHLPRDLYYGVYIASVLALFVLWARTTGRRLDVMLRRRWRLAVALGVVFAVVLALAVVLSEPSGPRPEGLALVWAYSGEESPTGPPTAYCSRRSRS